MWSNLSHILVSLTGKYVLQGSRKRTCVGGTWDGNEPTCVGLNQLHGYDKSLPPTVLFRHKNGQVREEIDNLVGSL